MKKNIIIILLTFLGLNIFGQSLDKELIDACYNNNEKAVFDLLRRGANPDSKTPAGITPLMYAVQNGNLLIVEKLLESGANPDIHTKKIPAALINAVINIDTAITYTLLEYGANPNIVDSLELTTALLISIKKKNFVITELLLYYGADPNINIAEVNPLLQAISTKTNPEIIKLLLKYKANPNIENKLGYTPLILSILYNDTTLANILLENGTSATKKSKALNIDPLEFAIKTHSIEFTDLLIPYYENNLDKYYSYALSRQFNYATSKIRKQTGKKYLKPIIGQMIITPSTLNTYNDIFGGMKIGISESRYNIDLKFGILSRFFPKTVLVEQSTDNYLQLRENRTMFSVELVKNFYLKEAAKYSYGFSVGLNEYFSFGSYRGSNLEIEKKKVLSPEIGMWYKIQNIKFSVMYSYLSIGTNFPIYSGFDINFMIPIK